MKTLDMQFLQL